MDGLVAYENSGDSSSDEDSDGGVATIAAPVKGKIVGLNLPKPSATTTTVASSAGDVASEEEPSLDASVRRHDWELQEAPQPPTGRAKRIQIVLPAIEADSDDDDEPTVKLPKRAANTQLLSMLPKPKTSLVADNKKMALLPSSLLRPKQQNQPRTKSFPKVLQNKPAVIAPASKPAVDSDDDGEGGDGDFFGIDKPAEEILPHHNLVSEDTFVGPRRPEEMFDAGPSFSGASSSSVSVELHPSQLYNLANAAYGECAPAPKAKPLPGHIPDSQVGKLIRRHEKEQFGMDVPSGDSMDFVDVSVDAQLGPDVRANLLRNITRPPGSSVAAGKKDDADSPGMLAKRKHQITYLAHVAKAKEESLKEQWSQNRFSRRQSAQKYGF